MANVWSVAASIPWFAWIAIVAIVCGSISGVITSCFRHHERMAMIRQGMNPDLAGSKSSVPEL